MFHVLFHAIITNEVPVTILQAYMSLPRHIRNGMLIRQNIVTDLCTAGGSQQFCKESRKRQRRITLNGIIPFPSLSAVLLSCRCVMFQEQYFE